MCRNKGCRSTGGGSGRRTLIESYVIGKETDLTSLGGESTRSRGPRPAPPNCREGVAARGVEEREEGPQRGRGSPEAASCCSVVGLPAEHTGSVCKQQLDCGARG